MPKVVESPKHASQELAGGQHGQHNMVNMVKIGKIVNLLLMK